MEPTKKLRRAIAIDFDGTICSSAYPDIGEPNWAIIKAAIECQRCGAGLILWTCREGAYLSAAIAACEKWGLHFDAVNQSLPEWIDAWGTNPRKVAANEYWDDRSLEIAGDGFRYANELQVYDIVRIIRCGQCEYSAPPAALTKKYGELGTLTCRNRNSPCNHRNVNQFDYCSYAKKKEPSNG